MNSFFSYIFSVLEFHNFWRSSNFLRAFLVENTCNTIDYVHCDHCQIKIYGKSSRFERGFRLSKLFVIRSNIYVVVLLYAPLAISYKVS